MSLKEVKAAAERLSHATSLCRRAERGLEYWIEASITGDVDSYAKAHRSLAEALRERVRRLVIVSPLPSWQEKHLNALVIHPLYEEYEKVKRAWKGPKPPQLPLHFPVEIEAGIGPYATGRHLVLFFENAIPGRNLLPVEDHVGFEFMPTWRIRMETAIPLLMQVAEPALRDQLERMAWSQAETDAAILESILAHETGHTCGQWQIFPRPPEFVDSAFERVPEEHLATFQVICDALAEASADAANVSDLSAGALIAMFSYHLMNLRHCWQLTPATESGWAPLLTDVDCLSGALVWSSALQPVGCNPSPLACDALREGLLKVADVVRTTISSIRGGHLDSAFGLTRFGLPPHFVTLLGSCPTQNLRTYDSRLHFQKQFSPFLSECVSKILK